MAERDFSRRDILKIAGTTAAGLTVGKMENWLSPQSSAPQFIPCLEGVGNVSYAETGARSESGLHIGTVLFEGQGAKDRKADYLEPHIVDYLPKNDPYYNYKTLKYREAGEELTVPGTTKRYIDIDKKKGVPGQIMQPNAVIIHTTQGPNDDTLRPAMDYYNYFQNNQIPRGGTGVATQFAVGKRGDAMHMAELFQNGVRRTYGCAYYPATIGIEMIERTVYGSKKEVPKGQYDKTIDIVKFCLDKYDLPVGTHSASWTSSRDQHMKNFRPGVYGHYQLNPNNKSDPGRGLMGDILKDLTAYKKQRTYR